ncbi:MAG TPA: type II CAAX endopeptidase family protein [Syntrophales bacterium]|nr:type II CAAX endopeptidase family protein [Syntrophales bacterium]
MMRESLMNRAHASAIVIRSALGWAAAALLGSTGILLMQIPGLSNMVAAQITAGTIGLIGGSSTVFLIRSSIGSVSWKQGLSLPLIWALCCIIGVTPQFFTSGTPLKMALLTFYAFTISGALGGAATTWIVESLRNDTTDPPVAPSVFIWSLGFGIAAVASGAVGERLSRIMPEWLAWLIAFEAMALIIGSAGGYSIVRLLGTFRPAQGTSAENDPSSRVRESAVQSVIILTLLCLPFYLNDFSDIYVKDWRSWLLIDYIAVKLFPCLIFLGLILSKKTDLRELGLTVPSPASFFAVFSIGALSGIFIDQNGYLTLGNIYGYFPFGGIPEITSPFWKRIDLTAGLIMTGICEELVFRGYLRFFLTRYIQRASIIVLISALAFGLIHWSGGGARVLVTAAIGAVFMILYLKTSSLPAVMAAHFAVNFVDYANIVPKEIFRFF